VWGLVLPQAYLALPRLALQSLLAHFPAVVGGAWPAPVLLGAAVPAEPGAAALGLAAAYIEKAGQPLRGVPAPGTSPPEALLCQLVELLPPADRLQTSFATALLGTRQVEVDPALPKGKGPQGSLAAQARLLLWRTLARTGTSLPPSVSLRQPPESWLQPVLPLSDLAPLLKQLFGQIAGAQVSGELREAASDELLSALERRIAQAGSHDTAALLDSLYRNGLFGTDGPFALLWPARMAVEARALGYLSPSTLAATFLPEAVPLLLNMDDGPAGARTLDLMTALAHLPPEAARRLRTPALQERLAELSALPRLEKEGDLAAALAALALYYKGSPDASGPRRT
jgi:hypothetical protein